RKYRDKSVQASAAAGLLPIGLAAHLRSAGGCPRNRQLSMPPRTGHRLGPRGGPAGRAAWRRRTEGRSWAVLRGPQTAYALQLAFDRARRATEPTCDLCRAVAFHAANGDPT